MQVLMKKTDVLERIKGCMLGGAVGDALGFPVEFYDDEGIFQRYGEFGITEYLLCGDTALISDDTQMSMFTADGMIFAEKKYQSPTKEQYVECVYESYLSWLSTQDEDFPVPQGVRKSELLKIKELHSRRAPGNTCLSALQSGVCGTPERKINQSKGCGGVMRVAPVALLLSQKEGVSRASIGETAARVAAITHGHSLGYIPAAFLALLIDEFIKFGYCDRTVPRALADTRAIFEESEELNYFCSLIARAEELANDPDVLDDLDAIRELGEGWIAEETVAIAVYCTLRHKDSFEQAVVASVNHSGDSDSTGAVTGNLTGALLGYGKIPQKYLEHLELKSELLDLAEQLSGDSSI